MKQITQEQRAAIVRKAIAERDAMLSASETTLEGTRKGSDPHVRTMPALVGTGQDDLQDDLQEALRLVRSLFLGGGRMEPSSIVLRNTLTDVITTLQRNVVGKSHE